MSETETKQVPMENDLDVEEVEVDPTIKKKKKRKKATPKPSKTPKQAKKKRKSSGSNRWIEHYMKWRKDNPEIVASTKDVKTLVGLARTSYIPVKKGFICVHCKGVTEPPFKRPE